MCNVLLVHHVLCKLLLTVLTGKMIRHSWIAFTHLLLPPHLLKRHVGLSPPPAKKSKKRSRGSDSSIEEAILESLKGLQEKRKECLPIEDELFGRQIAATLQGLDPRTKALGKMQIQQLLFSLEFGEPAGPVSSPYTSPYNFQL